MIRPMDNVSMYDMSLLQPKPRDNSSSLGDTSVGDGMSLNKLFVRINYISDFIEEKTRYAKICLFSLIEEGTAAG
jgi:hypothetical protein